MSLRIVTGKHSARVAEWEMQATGDARLRSPSGDDWAWAYVLDYWGTLDPLDEMILGTPLRELLWPGVDRWLP